MSTVKDIVRLFLVSSPYIDATATKDFPRVSACRQKSEVSETHFDAALTVLPPRNRTDDNARPNPLPTKDTATAEVIGILVETTDDT